MPAAIWSSGSGLAASASALPSRSASGTGRPMSASSPTNTSIAADELERLRGRRDTGWSIIRRRHVEGVAVSGRRDARFQSAR